MPWVDLADRSRALRDTTASVGLGVVTDFMLGKISGQWWLMAMICDWNVIVHDVL